MPESCAVCLYEFDGEDEIRWLRNCKHIFHRACLDRWMDHDQKTCPLCRTQFVPEEKQDEFNQRLWAASGVSDFYTEYSEYNSSSIQGIGVVLNGWGRKNNDLFGSCLCQLMLIGHIGGSSKPPEQTEPEIEMGQAESPSSILSVG
ncbi:e3 ubiquitin-protein ligase rha1b [Quercus suber]|uniref:E3 ubiquitin-protein ligase rha1b n=1 Tax=Quercus suber TaxID=58331 RepID=A0AAW0KZK3_QUESU